MTDAWYHSRDGKPAGPVSLKELRDHLSKTANWKEELVWQAGSDDWVQAGAVPELARIPPPLPIKRSGPEVAAEPAPAAAPKNRGRLVTAVISIGGFILAVLAASFGGVIGRTAVQTITQPSPEKLDAALEKGLRQGVEKVRSTLPRKVDDITTMVDASVDGMTVTYSYVVDVSALGPLTTIEADLRKFTVGNVCKSEMVPSMQYGARYRYEYRDTKGGHVGAFVIGIGDCGSPG